jgi:predicted nucleotide-binding protein (sugar kinase/HSP70/actin superfamily)
MTHTEVVSSDYFNAVLNSNVTSDIRKVKTPVVTGDRLILQERDENKAFTGREVSLKVTSANNKMKGLLQGFALVHFKVDGADAITTTVIPEDAQVNAGFTLPKIGEAAGAPAIHNDDTLPVD